MPTVSTHEALSTIVDRHRKAVESSFTDKQIEVMGQITREFIQCLRSGKKLLFCGNGGSAADSQHIAAEFIARFKKERKSLPAIALTTDTSILTAVANDYQFSEIFSRQVEGLAAEGDILVAISTSGNSQNVLNAVRAAKDNKVLTIGFSGGDGGELASLVDLCYLAKTQETSHVQEMHITALHAISEVVEEVFFGS